MNGYGFVNQMFSSPWEKTPMWAFWRLRWRRRVTICNPFRDTYSYWAYSAWRAIP